MDKPELAGEIDAVRGFAFLLLLLAGCAAPACKTVTITETKTVDRYIVVHDRPIHAALSDDINDAIASEKPIVLTSKAPTLDKLAKLNSAMWTAYTPFAKHKHHTTQAELARLLTTLGAMNAFISTHKH